MSSSYQHPVLVTGLGLVGPLGGDRETLWRRLLGGEVAVRPLVADAEGRLVDSATVSRDPVEPTEWCGAPAVVSGPPLSPEPVVDLALRAAREAAADARLHDRDRRALPAERIGCVIGTSKGGLLSARRLMRDGTGDWSLVPPDAAARVVAADLGLDGPRPCPVLACATGLAAIIRGAELVADGTCDAVVAGSSDASLVDVVVGSFRRLGVHSRGGVGRPFDADRDGFTVGEGAGMLVLESAESATRRGVTPYAEWLGGRTYGDPTGLTQIDPIGEVPARAIRDVLAAAAVPLEAVDLVQLHGTGTETNDLCESAALRAVFGTDPPAGCAVKGAIGHLLGAAGSVETVLAVLALRDGVVPPTANHRVPDPACPANLAAEARPADLRYVVKTSLGFGGHVAVGLLGRC